MSRLFLRLHPGVKVRFGLRHHPKAHIGVGGATEFGALALVGNQIHFARQLGHPKAMNHIGRPQSSLHHTSDRNVKFVRRDQTQLRVLKLPPPLTRGDVDA